MLDAYSVVGITSVMALASVSIMQEMRPKLEEIDKSNKAILEKGGMTIIEYDNSIFSDILSIQGVKDLYKRIDSATNGLASSLEKSLADVALSFDTFIFDAYGVFWEGNGFYAGSREMMRQLKDQGKQVIIVSNSSALGSDLRVSYAKRGLLEDNYSYLVSSGDLLQYHLQET